MMWFYIFTWKYVFKGNDYPGTPINFNGRTLDCHVDTTVMPLRN